MEECPVCLESLKQGQTITVDCCKKQFHVNCYMSAIHVNPTCPLCRKEQIVIPVQQQQQIIIIDQTTNRLRKNITNMCMILITCGIVSYMLLSTNN